MGRRILLLAGIVIVLIASSAPATTATPPQHAESISTLAELQAQERTNRTFIVTNTLYVADTTLQGHGCVLDGQHNSTLWGILVVNGMFRASNLTFRRGINGESESLHSPKNKSHFCSRGIPPNETANIGKAYACTGGALSAATALSAIQLTACNFESNLADRIGGAVAMVRSVQGNLSTCNFFANDLTSDKQKEGAALLISGDLSGISTGELAHLNEMPAYKVSRLTSCSFTSNGLTQNDKSTIFGTVCFKSQSDHASQANVASCVFQFNLYYKYLRSMTLCKGAAVFMERQYNSGSPFGVSTFATITGCIFQANGDYRSDTSDAKSTEGGGLHLGVDNKLRMTNCTFTSHKCSNGAALYIWNPFKRRGAVILDHCLFESNDARGNSGAAAYLLNNGNHLRHRHATWQTLFEGCSFNSSISSTDGGSLFAESIQPSFDTCVFQQSTSRSGKGGAIYIDHETPASVISTMFQSNYAAEFGGAIFADAFVGQATERNDEYVTLQLLSCTFIENSARLMGGALFLRRRPSLIQDCIFRVMTDRGAIAAAIFVDAPDLMYVMGTNIVSGSAIGQSTILSANYRYVNDWGLQYATHSSYSFGYGNNFVKIRSSDVPAGVGTITSCPAGRFSAETQTESLPIADWAGSFVTCPGLCPVGRQAQTNSSKLMFLLEEQCEQCPAGQYNDLLQHLAECKACAPGKFRSMPFGTSATGTSGCLDCPVDFYATGGNAACVACRAHYKAPSNGSRSCVVISETAEKTCSFEKMALVLPVAGEVPHIAKVQWHALDLLQPHCHDYRVVQSCSQLRMGSPPSARSACANKSGIIVSQSTFRAPFSAIMTPTNSFASLDAPGIYEFLVEVVAEGNAPSKSCTFPEPWLDPFASCIAKQLIWVSIDDVFEANNKVGCAANPQLVMTDSNAVGSPSNRGVTVRYGGPKFEACDDQIDHSSLEGVVGTFRGYLHVDWPTYDYDAFWPGLHGNVSYESWWRRWWDSNPDQDEMLIRFRVDVYISGKDELDVMLSQVEVDVPPVVIEMDTDSLEETASFFVTPIFVKRVGGVIQRCENHMCGIHAEGKPSEPVHYTLKFAGQPSRIRVLATSVTESAHSRGAATQLALSLAWEHADDGGMQGRVEYCILAADGRSTSNSASNITVDIARSALLGASNLTLEKTCATVSTRSGTGDATFPLSRTNASSLLVAVGRTLQTSFRAGIQFGVPLCLAVVARNDARRWSAPHNESIVCASVAWQTAKVGNAECIQSAGIANIVILDASEGDGQQHTEAGKSFQCLPCPAGTMAQATDHSNATGFALPSCARCAPGRYQDAAGSVLCKQCSAGRWLDLAKLASANDSFPCTSCANGGICRNGFKFVRAGWYLHADMTTGTSSRLVPCLAAPACIGVRNDADIEAALRQARALNLVVRPSGAHGNASLVFDYTLGWCAPGNTGKLCGLCQDGWHPNPDGLCQNCAGNDDRALLGVLFAVIHGVLLVVCVFALVRVAEREAATKNTAWQEKLVTRANNERQKLENTVQVILVVAQRLGSIDDAFPKFMEWPTFLTDLLRILKAIYLDVAALLRIVSPCQLHTSFGETLLANVSLMPWMAFFSLVCYVLGMVVIRVKLAIKAGLAAGRGQVRRHLRVHSQAMRFELLGVFLVLIKLSYPGVGKTLLLAFKCTPVGQARYLVQDLSVCCFCSSRHRSIVTVGILGLVGIIACVPILMAVFIIRHRRRQTALARRNSSAPTSLQLSTHFLLHRRQSSGLAVRGPSTRARASANATAEAEASMLPNLVRTENAEDTHTRMTAQLVHGRLKRAVAVTKVTMTHRVVRGFISRFRPARWWWFLVEMIVSLVLIAVLSLLADSAPALNLMGGLLIASFHLCLLAMLRPMSGNDNNALLVAGSGLYLFTLVQGVSKLLQAFLTANNHNPAAAASSSDGSLAATASGTSYTSYVDFDAVLTVAYVIAFCVFLVFSIRVAGCDTYAALHKCGFIVSGFTCCCMDKTARAAFVFGCCCKKGISRVAVVPDTGQTQGNRQSKDVKNKEPEESCGGRWLLTEGGNDIAITAPLVIRRCRDKVLDAAPDELSTEYVRCYLRLVQLQMQIHAVTVQSVARRFLAVQQRSEPTPRNKAAVAESSGAPTITTRKSQAEKESKHVRRVNGEEKMRVHSGDSEAARRILSADAQAHALAQESLGAAASKAKLNRHRKILKRLLAALSPTTSDRSEADLADLFARLDLDASGSITAQELLAVASRLKLGLGEADAAAIVALLDKDGGGDISWREFLAYMRERKTKLEQERHAHAELVRNATLRMDGGGDCGTERSGLQQNAAGGRARMALEQKLSLQRTVSKRVRDRRKSVEMIAQYENEVAVHNAEQAEEYERQRQRHERRRSVRALKKKEK